jgi:hypothetical protein
MCCESKSTIDFLINVFNFNINDYGVYLADACAYNKSIEVIKYLIGDKMMDPHVVNEYNLNCLQVSSLLNTSIDIIDYLINEQKMDPKKLSPNRSDCFMLSCRKNKNLDIIKYFRKNIDLNLYTNKQKYRCLLSACRSNTNVNVIQYLFKKFKINNSEFNKYNLNCFNHAFEYNPNLLVSKFLIEDTHLELKIKHNPTKCKLETIIELLASTHNYKRFNEFLQIIINKSSSLLQDVTIDINPLMVDKNIMKHKYFSEIKDPFGDKYEEFIEMVDDIVCAIPFSISSVCISPVKRHRIDFAQQSQKLFKHKGKIYYGDQNIIFNLILLFKDTKFDADDLCELLEPLPQYLLSLYLQSCYDNKFDFNDIESNDDFLEFLHWIDKYPTNVLSIDNFENEIVKYILVNKVPIDDYINELTSRYRLKHFYILINNKYYLENTD